MSECIGGAHNPLTHTELYEQAPALFTEEPHFEVSDKYHFIPTIDVITKISEYGWHPVSVQEANDYILSTQTFCIVSPYLLRRSIMKSILKLLPLLFLTLTFATNIDNMKVWNPQLNKLTKFERHIIVDKGTERAFSGKYVDTIDKGVYMCKVCGTALYKSDDKFSSHCGWPSFDDALFGAIKETPDRDGRRIEITCANCGAHMGHIFKGEGYTKKNIRHCVNSVSLRFDKKGTTLKKTIHPKIKKAYFSGGCFWGVEYYFEKIPGVKEVISGFMGGRVKNPSYKQVVYTNTGHLETVEVSYDTSKVSYETLAKAFFEIHDPTQTNGQGPDLGSQYLSAVFVGNRRERKTIDRLMEILKKKGLKVVTKVLDKTPFYSAEAYHQNHYKRKGGTPYCHTRVKRFD